MKRQRISLNTPTASFLVLVWQEQRSSRARPSTAWSTEQWGLRSGSLGLDWWTEEKGGGVAVLITFVIKPRLIHCRKLKPLQLSTYVLGHYFNAYIIEITNYKAKKKKKSTKILHSGRRQTSTPPLVFPWSCSASLHWVSSCRRSFTDASCRP